MVNMLGLPARVMSTELCEHGCVTIKLYEKQQLEQEQQQLLQKQQVELLHSVR